MEFDIKTPFFLKYVLLLTKTTSVNSFSLSTNTIQRLDILSIAFLTWV